MAEEQTLEWMTMQRDNLKHELDVLNPRMDAATARLETQQLQIADLQQRLDEVTKAYTAEAAAHQSAAQTAKVHGDRAVEAISLLRATQQEADRLKNLAEQRRLALTALLKHHAEAINSLMPLIAE